MILAPVHGRRFIVEIASCEGEVAMVSENHMKICLITRFFDLRYGGIGRFSVEMYNGLKTQGYDITPVSTNLPGTIGHVFYSTIELAFRLPRGCDVYHCLTPMEAIYAPKKLSIVTFHDLIPWIHLNSTHTHYAHGPTKKIMALMSEYYFKTAARIAARCSFITCNSEQTRRELIEHLDLDESRVSVVRFGISQDLEPREKKDRVYRVGTLSYLDQRKRIDLLLQAFQAADVCGELVIGGTGVDYHRLKKLAQDDQRINFLGFIPEQQLTDFYNSLDVFIFPTKVEGYGLPIVEALACKKPVVVLRDSIIPDEIKSRCIVVNDLAEFFRNPEPSPDPEANYRFAKAHDWNNCIREYIVLYKRVLEQR